MAVLGILLFAIIIFVVMNSYFDTLKREVESSTDIAVAREHLYEWEDLERKIENKKK